MWLTVIFNGFIVKSNAAHIIRSFLNFPLNLGDSNSKKIEIILIYFDCRYVNTCICCNVSILTVYNVFNTKRKLITIYFIIKIDGFFGSVVNVTVLLPLIFVKINSGFINCNSTGFRNGHCKIHISFGNNPNYTNIIAAVCYVPYVQGIRRCVFNYLTFAAVIGSSYPLINYLCALGNNNSFSEVNFKLNRFSVISFLNCRRSYKAVKPYVWNVRNIRSKYCIKRYIFIRHLGIYITVSVCPAVYYLTVILGYSRKILYISAPRKEASEIKLTVNYVLNLVYTCKVN